MVPPVRTLAWGAAALLLICGGAVAVTMLLALRALAAHALPLSAVTIVAGLGLVQLGCLVLMWHFFVMARRRIAMRVEAVASGLSDRIYLADARGIPHSHFEGSGWVTRSSHWWLDTVHPDDRSLWPMADVAEPQQVEIRLKDFNGEWRWHRLRATPLVDAQGRPSEWVGMLHDIHERRLAGERRDLEIEELRHRFKNLLTVIEAIAKNSRRLSHHADPGIEAYLERFLGRLHALGTAGDVFLAGRDNSIEVGALIRATLAPFMGERIHIEGPKITLSEESGARLGFAIHELATNALKYGALSVPEGRVTLTWSVTRTTDTHTIQFDWKERGGPEPVRPARPGFGTRMIKSVAQLEKGGRVDIDYLPEGLSCRIAFARPSVRIREETPPRPRVSRSPQSVRVRE